MTSVESAVETITHIGLPARRLTLNCQRNGIQSMSYEPYAARGQECWQVTTSGASSNIEDSLMTDDEILRDYVRIRVTTMRIFIEVKAYQEGDVMLARWRLAAALPLQSTRMQVERVRLMTAADYRYFRVCDTCGEKLPAALVRQVGDGTDTCRDCDS